MEFLTEKAHLPLLKEVSTLVNLKTDALMGVGTDMFPSGDKYEGEFKDGKLAIFKFTFIFVPTWEHISSNPH